MSEQAFLSGLVIKTQSGFFTVQTDERGPFVCKVPGRLLEQRLNTDPVALGDRVKISLVEELEDDTTKYSGIIEEVAPRVRAFTRQAPSPGGRTSNDQIDREQVIIANPDQVVFVFACAHPEPNFKMLDRFLVISEHAGIPILICANKVDLSGRGSEARELFLLYEAFGYPVFFTSAKSGKGVDALREALAGKISALTGPSGVGKSSLLNAVQPALGLAVQEVSRVQSKGKHTTVSAQLFPLEGGGWVADTPGVRAIGLFNVEPSEIDGYFRDILPFLGKCRFKDCRHQQEPGCAVTAAVEAGDIYFERYESYLRLREEAEEIYYRC